jgi:hypothetical protein
MPDTNSQSLKFAFNVPVRLFGPAVVSLTVADYGDGKKSDPMYTTQFFFPPTHPEVKAFKEALETVKVGKFGKDYKNPDFCYPFQLGDKMYANWERKGKAKGRDFAKGQIFVRASSKQFPPALSFINGRDLIDIPDETRTAMASKFFSGANAIVEITLSPYEGNGNRIPDGITAYLNKVCAVGGGDRIGGGSSASTFAAYTRSLGTVSDEDPTAGDDLAALA